MPKTNSALREHYLWRRTAQRKGPIRVYSIFTPRDDGAIFPEQQWVASTVNPSATSGPSLHPQTERGDRRRQKKKTCRGPLHASYLIDTRGKLREWLKDVWAREEGSMYPTSSSQARVSGLYKEEAADHLFLEKKLCSITTYRPT